MLALISNLEFRHLIESLVWNSGVAIQKSAIKLVCTPSDHDINILDFYILSILFHVLMATFLKSYFPSKPSLLEKDVVSLKGNVGLSAK